MKTVELAEITCCNCGTLFSIEEPLKRLRLTDGDSFYCPNGHAQSYTDSAKKKIT